MKVLVVTQDFSGFTGSEIVCLEVANFFAERGHIVVIRAERNSAALRVHLHQNVEIASRRVDIVDFDFVWSQHGHFCLNTTELEKLKSWNGTFVSVHLSGTTPAETYHYPFASRYVLCRVFNSSESLQALEGRTRSVGISLNLRNAAPKSFHISPRAGVGRLRKLLVVSNHLPEELQEAIKITVDSGIHVVHLGIASDYRLIMAKDIAEVDAVLTIGKTVQYSLCSARPVYCYDHFAGPGWISQENFEVAEFHNFSGRSHPEKKSGIKIFQELIDGFEDSERFVIENWDRISERYNLENFLDKLVAEVSGNLFDSEICIQEIDTMRGALVHADWIWGDVFITDEAISNRAKVNNLEREQARLQDIVNFWQVELRRHTDELVLLRAINIDFFERINMLENDLTINLRKPWRPIKAMLAHRLGYLVSWVIKPFSKVIAKSVKGFANRHDPNRYISNNASRIVSPIEEDHF